MENFSQAEQNTLSYRCEIDGLAGTRKDMIHIMKKQVTTIRLVGSIFTRFTSFGSCPLKENRTEKFWRIER